MYSNAYLDYLIYFHVDRDYFECHEVLEEHWKRRPRGQREVYWVGLIQVAVGLYHHRRGNRSGARRMYNKARSIIASNQEQITQLGIDVPSLLQMLLDQKNRAQNPHQPFTDINLPLNHDSLVRACHERSLELGKQWKICDRQNELTIIHKHSMRDRDEVIAEREQQLQRRHIMRRNKK